jgi:hypothetical protein
MNLINHVGTETCSTWLMSRGRGGVIWSIQFHIIIAKMIKWNLNKLKSIYFSSVVVWGIELKTVLVICKYKYNYKYIILSRLRLYQWLCLIDWLLSVSFNAVGGYYTRLNNINLRFNMYFIMHVYITSNIISFNV